MKKPVKKMDGGMMSRPGVLSGGTKKIGRRDEGNDEMRRGIPNRSGMPKKPDVSLPYMPQKPSKPNLGRPDVTLPYMPQNPVKKPPTGGPMQPSKPSMPAMPRSMSVPGGMPLRRAKGGVAKKMTKGMKKK